MNRVHLHVDRLVLRGFSESERPAVLDAMRQELTQRLASSPIPSDRAGLAPVSRTLAVREGEKAGAIGRKAGREVASILRSPGSKS